MFDQATAEKIGYYVYLLFDPKEPRAPFYVGKGKGNRVFAHAIGDEQLLKQESVGADPDIDEGQFKGESTLDPRLDKIKEIVERGDEVERRIVAFDLEEQEALTLEAGLISVLDRVCPGCLTNLVRGHGSFHHMMSAEDVASTFGAEDLHTDRRVVTIKIESLWSELIERHQDASSVPDDEIYQAVRASWVLNPNRAERADYVLAVARGLVRGVYPSVGWEREKANPARCFFDKGDMTVPEEEEREFLGKSVAHTSRKGAANPIRYWNC